MCGGKGAGGVFFYCSLQPGNVVLFGGVHVWLSYLPDPHNIIRINECSPFLFEKALELSRGGQHFLAFTGRGWGSKCFGPLLGGIKNVQASP